MRFLQGTEVSECPGHLVSVSFEVSFLPYFRTEHFGDVMGHTGLFGNADYHIVY